MMCLKFFSRSTMNLQLISKRYRIERHSSTSTYIHLPSDFRESLQIQDQYLLGYWILSLPKYTQAVSSYSQLSPSPSLSHSLYLHQLKLKRFFPCIIALTEKNLQKKKTPLFPSLKIQSNGKSWNTIKSRKMLLVNLSFTLFIAL